MLRDIVLTFHNQGLRSFIEVDLCPECPRLNEKGCCGYYSPVFYPTDLAYILLNRPSLLDLIFSLPHLTVLDASVTVNSLPDGEGYRCQFHSRQKGCLLPMLLRESVCRHFVCPGVGWWKEESLAHWKQFFDQLEEYEIAVNNRISEELKRRGLTLRVPELRKAFYQNLIPLFKKETEVAPEFFSSCPASETVVLRRRLSFGEEWTL